MSQPGTQIACSTCRAALNADARFCPSCGSAQSSAGTNPPAGPPDPYSHLIGREIGGRYRVLAKLGEGGMGAVFRAEQISLKRTIALKVLRPELSTEPGMVRRFNAEAELAAKLNHPNTVTLFDFGQDQDGALFIAMEYLEGRSLRDLLYRGGPLAPERTLAIAEQICASLADAHSHGIVHRDLKPDNVMLTRRGKSEDVVRVLDFGIAKLRDEQGVTQMPMTRAGDMLGTPQYMAPEQIRGETVDARTDVYALGAMLYEMVTGRLPFEAPTLMGILSKHLTEAPMPPSQRRPDLGIPPVIDELVMAALHKEPAARPPTMEAIAERLAAIASSLGSRSGAISTPAVGAYPAPSFHSLPPGVPPMPVGAMDGRMSPPGLAGMPAGAAASGHGSSPPPGHGPPGVPSPLQGIGAPIRSAVPTPAALHPMSGAVAAPRRGLWPWLLALLVVAGGSGGGFLWWRQHSAAADASAGAGDDDDQDAGLDRPAPDDVVPDKPADGERPFRPAPSGFTIPKEREFYRGLNGGGAGALAELGAALPAGTWRDHPLGFAVKVPDGFQYSDGPVSGAASFLGTHAGYATGIIVYGVARHDPAWSFADADLGSAVTAMLTNVGGVAKDVDRTRRGSEVLRGVADFPAIAGRGEFRLYRGTSAVALVVIGFDSQLFKKTAALRRAFFARWVRPPHAHSPSPSASP